MKLLFPLGTEQEQMMEAVPNPLPCALKMCSVRPALLEVQ